MPITHRPRTPLNQDGALDKPLWLPFNPVSFSDILGCDLLRMTPVDSPLENMKYMSAVSTMISLVALGLSWAAHATAGDRQRRPAIHIEDVRSFYRLYDATGGHPTAAQLQQYLDHGSAGFHRLAQLRHVTGASIAAAMAKRPDVYANAKRCMAVLPSGRLRVAAALHELGRLYPQARFPPVTIVVGRGKPVGVADESGVMIGLEALCAVTWMEPNLEDRFVHVVVHEYAHVQQAIASPGLYNDEKPTVLEESLIEGAAEFIDELTSGSVSDTDLPAIVKGREKSVEKAFVADEDKTDLSKWLYNGTLTRPGDLGYWVGYRIVRSYYEHAPDKALALRDIIGMKDPKAFLARSGWYPGVEPPPARSCRRSGACRDPGVRLR